MEAIVLDYLDQLSDTFTEPRKRVFWGYLLLALGIGTIWLRWKLGQGWRRVIATTLSPGIWWSASARADYLLVLINKLLMILIAPALLTQTVLATWLFGFFFSQFGMPPSAGSLLPDWGVAAAFTLTLFLLDDFARYLVHRVMHEVPALWAFHKVHHSARSLTPLTVMRTHPVEGVLFTLRSALVQGVTIGSFLYLFGSQVDLVTVLGVNIAVFAFNVAGSNLRHSHVQLWYPKAVEHLLISPAQHQIHHSTTPRHFDKNFGAVLAIWDWLGGSLHLSEPGADIRFGIRERVEEGEHSLKRLYLTPFGESFGILKGSIAQLLPDRSL
ncbi:sterol desaturase family protein [Marinobacterium jannaschii]|uniref:sterol desaturase family protein n=1 Tax=Marinobacterium jannaschii TaxID=64970 RepID=UPI000483FD13|nr:sterol desaturase family protein [Marinobacterium jannaschii]